MALGLRLWRPRLLPLIFGSVVFAARSEAQSTMPCVAVDSSAYATTRFADSSVWFRNEHRAFVEVYGYYALTESDYRTRSKTRPQGCFRRVPLYDGCELLQSEVDWPLRAKLTLSEADSLVHLLNDTSSYWPDGESACMFLPRHHFVFHNGAGEIVGHIALCFQCFELGASPRLAIDVPGALRKPALRWLESLCERHGLFPPNVRDASWLYFDYMR